MDTQTQEAPAKRRHRSGKEIIIPSAAQFRAARAFVGIGWTQLKISEAFGVEKSTLAMIEQHGKLSEEMAVKLINGYLTLGVKFVGNGVSSTHSKKKAGNRPA